MAYGTMGYVVRLGSGPFTYREVADVARCWRECRDEIVLVTGCFDLLHVGQVRFLEEAARQGNRLIVSVGSDAHVRSLKGPGRPVLSAASRVAMVAALRCVDCAVVADERMRTRAVNFRRLMAMTKPNVLVVPERDPNLEAKIKAATACGVAVREIPRVRDLDAKSTTRLLSKIRRTKT